MSLEIIERCWLFANRAHETAVAAIPGPVGEHAGYHIALMLLAESMRASLYGLILAKRGSVPEEENPPVSLLFLARFLHEEGHRPLDASHAELLAAIDRLQVRGFERFYVRKEDCQGNFMPGLRLAELLARDLRAEFERLKAEG